MRNPQGIPYVLTIALLLHLSACQFVHSPTFIPDTISTTQTDPASFPSTQESMPIPTLSSETSPTELKLENPAGPMVLFVTSDPCLVKAVSVNGGDAITLTSNPPIYDCWRPKFSPDGKKLAFILMDGQYDLYVMNLDGSGLTRVADAMAFAWSPDSSQLVYKTNDPETQIGRIEITTINGDNAHGIGYQDVSICTTCDADIDLSWSPDGEWIYSPADLDFPDSGFFTANIFKVDGSMHSQLSPNDISIFTAAAWSPNSQRAALPILKPENGCGELHIMASEGAAQIIRADNAYKKGEPGISPSCFNLASSTWSSDGSTIVASGYPQGNFATGAILFERILLVSPATQKVDILEYWPGHPGSFLWSPDGANIVFTASPDLASSGSADGPIVIMKNNLEFAEYSVLDQKVKNSPGAIYWLEN